MIRATVLSAAALALAGCGASASSAGNFAGAERDVADQVEALQSAGESRDGAKLCDDVLARELRERMAARGSTCAEQVEQAMADADDFRIDVEDVTIQGARATARVRARSDGAERQKTIALVRERGGWRVSSLD